MRPTGRGAPLGRSRGRSGDDQPERVRRRVPEERGAVALRGIQSGLLDAARERGSRSLSSGSTIVAWRREAVPGGGGGAPRALPGVRAEVMVIAAGAEERGLRAELRHQRRSRARRGRRRSSRRSSRTLRCTWPMTVPAGRPSNGSDAGSSSSPSRLSTSSGSVVIRVGHLPFPQLARPIPVDLDPVPVRIAEVDRLADEVVGEPDERDAVARGVRQPAREIDAFGQEQREVIEARRVPRGAAPGVLHQHDQLAAAGAEPGPVRRRSRTSSPICSR